MVRRAAGTPPELQGYRPVSHLGSGGFADVFLYEQDLPRRRVAVKVLAESAVNADVQERFVAEANAMAMLSTHPSIVTIYFAGIAPDGRPCIAMEYCPRPNLSVRYRRETIPVAEALRIGVRLASAVETAHRAGILHRDIKPANVLVTEYGWPALTDFGISAQVDTVGEAEGMSVPWSAPELFDEQPYADARTDVYALGASVYALLAGRSPFEVAGGDNHASALIARIERDAVRATGRRDSTPLLEQVLARSMHKRSEARFRSAYDFALGLNEVERVLGLTPTPIDVMDNVASAVQAAEADDSTRMRGVVTISDDTAPRSTLTPSTRRPVPVGTEDGPGPAGRGRLLVGVGLLVVLIGGVIAVLVLGPGGVAPAPPPSSPRTVVAAAPPSPPQQLSCSRSGSSISCSWVTPAGVIGEVSYQWNFTERAGDLSTVGTTRFTAVLPAGVQPCVQVRTISGGRASDSTSVCAG